MDLNSIATPIIVAALLAVGGLLISIVKMVYKLGEKIDNQEGLMQITLKGSRTCSKGTHAALEAIQTGKANGNVTEALKDLEAFDKEAYEFMTNQLCS